MVPRFLLTSCLLSVLLTAGASAQDATRRYALLVGVQQYDSTDLEDLRYTENDVEKLAEILQRKPQPYKGVVVMTRTRGLKDPELMPTAENIRKQLGKLAARCEKEDLLLVAMTGHGLQPKGGKALFCGYKARLDDEKTFLPLDEVYSTLEDSDAGMKVLVVDACRNDPGGKGIKLTTKNEKDYEQLTTANKPPAGVVALFSCSPGERSWESEQIQHGVFFGFLNQGMGGAAARPNEETISWSSLAGYVQDGVDRESKKTRRTQRPHFKGDVNSTIPLMILPPGATTLIETFKTVKLGEVPASWERDDAIGVRRFQGMLCLESDSNGSHSISTPKLRMEGDFIVDLIVDYGHYSTFSMVLEGRENAPSLELILRAATSGEPGIELGGVKADENFPNLPDWSQPRPRLRLEREGDTFRVIVNGKAMLARPFRDRKDFERLKFIFTYPEGTPGDFKPRLYAVGVSPRPASPKKP